MVKIGDIAKATGFSVTTVSKALNNYSDISLKTKEIVINKAKELGYVPNAHARSLVMKKSFTIGVILDDITHNGLEHPFFSGLAQAFRTAIEDKGYDMLLIANEIANSPVDSYLNHCRQRGVDGVLILCTNSENPDLIELLDSQVPSVMFDVPNLECNCVYSDHYAGAKEAMDFIIGLGHRRIAHIYGDDITFAGYERRKAYMDALHEHNIPLRGEYMIDGGFFEFAKGEAAAEYLFDLPIPPTAIFAAGDAMALGVIRSCYKRHLRVPDDVTIIGFDNINLLNLTTPRLTTIGQNIPLIAKELAKMLIDEIEVGEKTGIAKVKIPTHLVEGETHRAYEMTTSKEDL